MQAREEQKAVEFSLEFLKDIAAKNVLILQSYIKPALTYVQSNFAVTNLRV